MRNRLALIWGILQINFLFFLIIPFKSSFPDSYFKPNIKRISIPKKTLLSLSAFIKKITVFISPFEFMYKCYLSDINFLNKMELMFNCSYFMNFSINELKHSNCYLRYTEIRNRIFLKAAIIR